MRRRLNSKMILPADNCIFRSAFDSKMDCPIQGEKIDRHSPLPQRDKKKGKQSKKTSKKTERDRESDKKNGFPCSL